MARSGDAPAFTAPFLSMVRLPFRARRVTCGRPKAGQLPRRRRYVVSCASRGGEAGRINAVRVDAARIDAARHDAAQDDTAQIDTSLIDSSRVDTPTNARKSSRIGIFATASASTAEKTSTSSEPSSSGGGLLSLRPRASLEAVGVPILAFFALGVAALSVKLVKVLMGKWKSTENVGRNAPSSVITSPEMEKELHVYKCGGCGYEIYPARGREFKFFPDSFKCPLCGSSREAFFDKNDATDERNQEFDEDGERDDLEPAGLPDFEGPGAAGASTGPAVSTAEATADAPEPKPE